MIRRIVLLLWLAAAMLGARAQTVVQPVEIDSDNTVLEGSEVSLKGHVRISDGTFLLLADEGRMKQVSATSREATLVGHIQFTRGEVRLLADKLIYNLDDGSFTAENIRFGSHPYFAEGFSAEGSRKEITISRAKLSYGEPGPWQPTVIADKVIIAPGQRVRTESAAGGIGHMQPLPFPKFEHNIAQPFPLTAQLTGGYRRSLGLFADATLHVPVSPSVRFGADVGLFTNRGVMIGPSGRYGEWRGRPAREPDVDLPDMGGTPMPVQDSRPASMRGYFRSGFINDHGDKGVDLLGRPVPEERAFVEWQHQQTLAENLSLNAQLNWWRDSEVLRDFRPRAFFPVQEPDTFLEAIHAGPNFFVSAFARFQPNKFHRVQQRLPEIRFDLLPLAVGNGFYERFEASVVTLREDTSKTYLLTPPLTPPITPDLLFGPGESYYANSSGTRISPHFFGFARQTTRIDAYYGLERPIAPTNWLTLTPVAGGRLTSYAHTRDTAIYHYGSLLRPPTEVVGHGGYTRLLGELGADAVLRASGVFDYKNPQWKIDGLRHLLTPRLSYRYIPRADKGRGRIIPIDREVFSTYLRPLGLGDQRNLDDLHATNTLRLAIDNIVQTRDAVLGTRDLLALNVANDFRFHREPGERDVSETHVEAALMPAPWLQFDLYESFAPQDFTVRELNSGVTIHDGNAWAVRFGNNYLRRDIQDFSVDGRVRLNEKYEARTKLHYDARKQRFTEQAYGIVQNLGNTWLISYTVSLYSGRRRESSFGFRVEIDTVRF